MDTVKTFDTARALILLDAEKKILTQQQYRTLRGQILGGNPDGAMRGLNKILQKQGRAKL